MATPVIQFHQVSKHFNQRYVLNDLTFSVEQGETVLLMGPSGCGKTTILRCINGLEPVQDGNVLVQGISLTSPPLGFQWNTFRSGIGIVFQQFNLFPHLTVLQNVLLGPVHVKGMSQAAAREKAMGLLETIGISSKASSFPSRLSGGEKQRVAIARALAMDPPILLLDEPTSALDPIMTAEILDLLRKTTHQGRTVLIVTHEVLLANQVGDRILFLNNGHIELEGPPSFFQTQLSHPIAKRYFETCVTHSVTETSVSNP